MQTNLSGKTYVVTGATSGIGLAVAEILVRSGAFVIGIGHSKERCREVENRLRYLAHGGEVQYIVHDLALQSQVSESARKIREILAAHGVSSENGVGLNGLVNNVGVFTYWLTLTGEGFETQWAVNYLAAFRLTHELLPLLQAANTGRVVTVSSDSHYGTRLNWEDVQLRRHYNGLRAYSQTKLAGVLFTLELNRRLGEESSVRAFAADPGLVKTDIASKGTPAMVRWLWERRRSGGISPEESAQGIVYLLSDDSIQNSPEVYWKHGAPKAASQQALNLQDASRLWKLSEQMCGIVEE